jgi:hypothetical protein
MGKFIDGINGATVGKIGKTHGSSWKGIPYVKGPFKKRTKNISADEVANRGKFTLTQYWLKPLLGFVREGFKGYTPTVEGFNAAKSYLMRNAIVGEKPNYEIDPSLVLVSFGNLPLSSDVVVEQTAADQLTFSWNPEEIRDGHGRDQVMLLAYDIENKEAFYTTLGQFRSTGSDTLQLSNKTGITYHLYLAFNSAERTSQSNSLYLGAVTI